MHGKCPAGPATSQVPCPGWSPCSPWTLTEHSQVPDVDPVLGRQLCETDKFLGLLCASEEADMGQLANRTMGIRVLILKQIK